MPNNDTLPLRTNNGYTARQPPTDNCSFSWLTLLGFLFLTFNSVTVIYQSKSDFYSAAFVVMSYLDLLALFYFLRLYGRDVSRYGHRSGSSKAAVWFLISLLAIMFSFKMAALFQQPISGVAYTMATVLSLLLFFEFFVRRNPEPNLLPTQGPTFSANHV